MTTPESTVEAVDKRLAEIFPDWESDQRRGIAAELTGVAIATLPAATEQPMDLHAALDFADNPRPYHTLQAPADTNGELYEALRVLAAAYRASPADQAKLIEEMVERLEFWADRGTTDEVLAGGSGDDEWRFASAERRVAMMGDRKRRHDEEVLAARDIITRARNGSDHNG